MRIKIPHTKEYESLYRREWEKQNIQDYKDNPKLKPNKLMRSWVDNERTSPSPATKPRAGMSAAARTINKLLHNGLSIMNIADALGQDYLYVKKLVILHNLPTIVEPPKET